MRMFKLAGLLAAMLCAAAPQAQAKLITAEYNGVVDVGAFDYLGVFGPANSSLEGLPIKVVFDIDTSRGTYFLDITGGVDFFEYRLDYGALGPILTSYVTIGTTTVSWSPNNSSRTAAFLALPHPVFRPDGYSAIDQISDWTDGNVSMQVFADVYLRNMSLPYGIEALGSGVVDPALAIGAHGVAEAWQGSGQSRVQGWYAPYLISTYSLTAVPEPLTLSVFGFGVAGALALRRRRIAK
jgi:hypothetical protein